MTPRQAKRWVLLALLIVAVAEVVGSLREGAGLPGIRMPIGLGITGLGLLILAEVVPELAGPLAALIAVSALLAERAPWDAVIDALGARRASATARPAPSLSV